MRQGFAQVLRGEIHDGGKLAQGMIRVPLGKVRERIRGMLALPNCQAASISASRLADCVDLGEGVVA